jgi:MSHA biogenesis protein MshG
VKSFHYQGVSRYGETVTGRLKGFDQGDVVKNLREQGISPTHIDIEKTGSAFLGRELRNPFKKTNGMDDMAHLSWELHYLLKSGVPLLTALEGLKNNYQGSHFEAIIKQLIATLYAGHTFSTALAEHPRYFDNLMVSMVRIGETTNKLDEMFLLHHQYLNRNRDFKRQLTNILKQPILGLVGITFTLLVINISVVPSLVRIFNTFHAELPFITRIMIEMSNVTVNYWPHMLATVAGLVIGFQLYVSTPAGRYKWHKTIFQLPMVGKLLRRFVIVRLINSLSVAIHAGIPSANALEMALETCENLYARDKVKQILKKMDMGISFAESVVMVDFFDPMIQQMIDVGEKTSNFAEMISDVAEFTNRELEHKIQATTSSMQPIFTLVLAVMVGFVAISLFLPMWDIIYAV